MITWKIEITMNHDRYRFVIEAPTLDLADREAMENIPAIYKDKPRTMIGQAFDITEYNRRDEATERFTRHGFNGPRLSLKG